MWAAAAWVTCRSPSGWQRPQSQDWLGIGLGLGLGLGFGFGFGVRVRVRVLARVRVRVRSHLDRDDALGPERRRDNGEQAGAGADLQHDRAARYDLLEVEVEVEVEVEAEAEV